jgi:hypothetical protein
MMMGTLLPAGRRRIYLLLTLLVGLMLAGCRTCPIDACHARKAHYHNGVKYRARPIWKMQFPAIGERYKNQHDGDNKRKQSDHSKSLK